MKALILKEPRCLEYKERPYPICGIDQVTVHVDAVGICGSDIGAILGKNPMFTFPRVLGHEVAGTVVDVGANVHAMTIGDRVCLMPCIACGSCHACRRGHTNSCEALRLYGVHEDGGLQEFLTAPEVNWIKIPFNAKMEEIAIIEPLTIGAHAVAKLELCPDDKVLVIGAGPIGTGCAVNAKIYGAKVTLADTSEFRRKFVSERFHIDVLDPKSYDYEEALNYITVGEMFDAVIDTTAAKSSMENDWRWIANGGKIVFVGIYNGKLEIEDLQFHLKEPTLYTTRNSILADYNRVIQCWQRGRINLGDFISNVVTFNRAAEEIHQWLLPRSSFFKGVVKFP